MGSTDVDVTLQRSVDMMCLGQREGIGEQIRNWVNQNWASEYKEDVSGGS